jgi:hypothetical protein
LTDERFTDKRFALVSTREEGEFWCSIHEGTHRKDFLLLCDIDETVGPVSRAKWTYIFSSHDPARYKEITKNSPKRVYILPTWSELELMFVSADKQIGDWYENFVLFGGVPRYIFNPDLTAGALSRLIQAVDQK